MVPLLSICIPTFNRSGFLRVMLEALLPQVVEAGGEVEVVVLDNASTDDTGPVVEAARRLGPVSYVRNDVNLGPIVNIARGPGERARGAYVWVMGDHNLLAPGGLARVRAMLRAHPGLDVFNVNFRCATYPEHWPASAVGGFAGAFSYLASPDLDARPVARWHELIQGVNGLCTQLYAHIVRREVWQTYWRDRRIPEIYSDGLSAYPHTWMIAETRFDAPSFYLGPPVFTIFNGAQSWSDPAVRAKVYGVCLPDLIDLYARKGLPADRAREAREFARQQAYRAMRVLFETPEAHGGPGRKAAQALRRAGLRHRYLWVPIARAFVDAESSAAARLVVRAQGAFERWHQYWFYNSRPARWIRHQQR